MSRLAIRLTLGILAVGAVILLAALLAAPVHEALLGGPPAGEYDYDKGFLRVFRRLLLIPLVVLFLLVARPWRDGLLRPYGLLGPEARWGPALLAIPVTLVALAAVLGANLQLGWLRWEDPPRWGTFQDRLVTRGFGGLALACVEEWFFRGWLLQRLARRLVLWQAALGAAAVYAFVHAFKPRDLTVAVSHDAGGALEALGRWIAYALDPAAFGPAFLGLLLFGLLLTALYLRTRTLWTSVAVHAAAVWILFSHGALTEPVAGRPWWSGSKWLYDGPVAWLLFVAAIGLSWPRRGARLPGFAGESAAPSADRVG